jgi:hypothetical protein
MKVNPWMRTTAFVVTVQFLNLQVNAAMGNQALAEMNPEYRAVMAQAESRLGSFVDGMSEQAQINFGYKIYRLGVKARNHINQMSEEKFVKRLGRLNSQNTAAEQGPITAEESDLANEVNQIDELNTVQASFAGAEQKVSPVLTSKTQFVENLDRVLVSFGSTVQTNGKLSIEKKASFQNQFQKTTSASEMRSPAGVKLLKSLLKILVATLAAIVISVIVSMVLVLIGTSLPMIFIAMLVGGVVLLLIKD